MIKFILERYANTNSQEGEPTPKLNKTNDNPEVNQSTVALRNLKHTQDHIQEMRRRLSVLLIRDQKNQKKAKQNQRKFQFHSKIQQQITKQKRRKIKHIQSLNKHLELSKQKIQATRNQRNQNLKTARQSLHQVKRQEHQKIKKQSQSYQKSIQKMKIEEITTKANKRKAINHMERLQKQHIAEYFFSKRNNFRQNSARQGSKFQSRRSQRQKLLQQLSARQSQLIQRQSASRAALDQTSKKLHKVTAILKPIKRQKSTSDFSSERHLTQTKNNQQYVFL